MSGFYPHNPNLGQQQQTDTRGVIVDQCFVSKFVVAAAAAVAASNTGIHAAVTDTGSDQTITSGITNPATPRNVTATAGGTAGDIKAVQVVVTGTNFADEVITETLPAFTVNTAGTVQGNKAFKTVTSFVVPAHDGTGATTALGYGEKLGLPDKLPTNTVLLASLGGTKEATAPTVTASASAVESNTADLNSALNGSEVAIYYMV